MGEGLTSFNCADWRRYDALQRLAGANAAAAAEHSPMLWTELAAGASRQRANGCAEAYFTEARWRGTCLRELRRARPLAHRCERRARECRGAGRAWDAETFEALGVVATGHWRHNAAEADARAAGFSRDAARARTACEAAERAALQQRARKHAALFHKELARQEYMHSIFAW